MLCFQTIERYFRLLNKRFCLNTNQFKLYYEFFQYIIESCLKINSSINYLSFSLLLVTTHKKGRLNRDKEKENQNQLDIDYILSKQYTHTQKLFYS